MKQDFNDIINSETPVLIDFYADWCGPCKAMAPILKDVKSNMGEQVKILKIDTDKNRQVASKYGIRSIPTLILFQNGKIKWRHSGVMPARDIESNVLKHSA
jgi:thioredoxin 1